MIWILTYYTLLHNTSVVCIYFVSLFFKHFPLCLIIPHGKLCSWYTICVCWHQGADRAMPYERISHVQKDWAVENPHWISFSISQTNHANRTLCLSSWSKYIVEVYLLDSAPGCIGQLGCGSAWRSPAGAFFSHDQSLSTRTGGWADQMWASDVTDF